MPTTSTEQLYLELVNRSRMDPGGEFARYSTGEYESAITFFGVDMDAFKVAMDAYNPVHPYAWNDQLSDAGYINNNLMIEYDTQSHFVGGTTPESRAREAGFDGYPGENVYAYSKTPEHSQAGFMIDWGYDDGDYINGKLRADWQEFGDGMQDLAGHRNAIMSSNLDIIGIAITDELDPSTKVGPILVTQMFSYSSDIFMVGVVAFDEDGDAFYDIGEGLGGITVDLKGNNRSYQTETWESGGYQVAVDPGVYAVTFSGGALEGKITKNVIIGDVNEKLDLYLTDLDFTDTPVMPDPLPGGTHIGTSGDDTFQGSSKSETFILSGGEDAVFAGFGYDVVELSQSSRDSTVRYQEDGDVYVSERASNVVNSVYAEDIEELRFDDGKVLPVYDTLHLLSDAQFSQLMQVYMAYFNRAPDSEGLSFWADKLATGMDMKTIANYFFDQPETRSFYSNPNDPEVFVTEVYANVLGRTPDVAGKAFWIEMIKEGHSTQGEFVLDILDGIQAGSPDASYIKQKTDLGALYGGVFGMNDVQDASDVFQIFGDADEQNLQQAKTYIYETYFAINPQQEPGLIINMSAFIDDPFNTFG